MLINNKYYHIDNADATGGYLDINLNNCEYYFLLYIDGELNATDKKAVELFLQEHPAQQMSFDYLQASTLPLEEDFSVDKNSLFRETIITKENVETYYLLQLDDALTKEELKKLTTFLNAHPELQETLLLLQKTKLSVPELSFNKSLLYKTSDSLFANENNIAEILTSYIDGETTDAQNKKIDLLVAHNNDLQKELALLQNTRLEKEVLVYPYKKDLYKKEKRTAPLIPIWLRYAAAACLLFFTTWFFTNRTTSKKDSGIVKSTLITPNENGAKAIPVQTTTVPNNPVTTTIVPNNTIATPLTTIPNNTITNRATIVKTTLNTKDGVTNLPKQRNTNTNIINNNETVLNKSEKGIGQEKEEQDLQTIVPTVLKDSDNGIANTTLPVAAIADINSTSNIDNVALTAANHTDVTLMTFDATNLDKKQKVKKLRSKIGSFLKQKVSSIANGSFAIGKYEIALAK
jgi:hypothetical protein